MIFEQFYWEETFQAKLEWFKRTFLLTVPIEENKHNVKLLLFYTQADGVTTATLDKNVLPIIDQIHNTTNVAIFRYHVTRLISEGGCT